MILQLLLLAVSLQTASAGTPNNVDALFAERLAELEKQQSQSQAQLPTIAVSGSPANASNPIAESFVAYSIEFSSFPDFAGNLSSPNNFSNNLLNNLKDLQGTKPFIRSGGNTQDYAIYNASLTVATNGTIDPSRSPDYPTTLYIGPSYFESYLTFPDVKFVHGFNLGANSTAARQRLLDSVPLACRALSHGNLLEWQLGNEPDLFNVSAQGPVRPSTYDDVQYVAEWQNLTTIIMDIVRRECPSIATNEWIAPSFATVRTTDGLTWSKTFAAGLNDQHKLVSIDSHNYISGATTPGVTLRGTLMNHTRTLIASEVFLGVKRNLSSYNLPFILGETNSLFNQGAPGLSNSFGAALWVLDFNLYCASQNVKRVHMHMGTNYRYQSWQPITTDLVDIGTKAPYYGNIAVAAALGNLTGKETQVKHIPLDAETDAAYATYRNGGLARLTVINMNQYNYTGNEGNGGSRPITIHNFTLPPSCAGNANVQRLMANGSDAITGVTFNGMSYNYELDLGKPIRLTNVTRDEPAFVAQNGGLSVNVPWSSAAIVNVSC